MSWWATICEQNLSQGDIIKQLLFASPPASPVFVQKSSQGGGRVWREIPHFEPDHDGLAHFVGRGRMVPGIVLSHDCTMDNDGEKARILIAPVFPWDKLESQPEEYREAVRRQEQRSFVPLENLPAPFSGDCYADLRIINCVDRRAINLNDRIASMSAKGLERLQHQLADFFIRIDVPNEHLALTRKSQPGQNGRQR